MLMQNFKTAADLGITDPQKEALMKTLVLLETGRLVHVRDPEITGEIGSKFSGHFNMDKWSWETDCGSVCCIGGTAELVGGFPRGHLEDAALHNDGLNRLFYPKDSRIDWDVITTDQAATALRSYLTTGEARWGVAVS